MSCDRVSAGNSACGTVQREVDQDSILFDFGSCLVRVSEGSPADTGSVPNIRLDLIFSYRSFFLWLHYVSCLA